MSNGAKTRLITFDPHEKGVKEISASEFLSVEEYLKQFGGLDIKCIQNSHRDLAKLAAKRAAEKATETKREDSDRRF